jgi:hypothetical protein
VARGYALSITACTVVALLAPSSIKAQIRSGFQVRINPSLGVALPFGGPLINEARLEKNKVMAALFSTRIMVSPGRRFGVEASVALSRGLVAVRDSADFVRDIPAMLVLTGIKGVMRINPGIRDGVGLHIGAGPGFISRSGRAWIDTRPKGPTMAWIISGGGSARLSPRSSIVFRVELEDYISWAQFNVGLPTETRALLHHDLIWSLGLTITIFGGR